MNLLQRLPYGYNTSEKTDMKRFLIQVPESQSPFFMELMQQLNLQVEPEELSDEEEDILEKYQNRVLEK
jgi:hypothetical protein